MKDKVEIHIDGACRGNPGLGGWGVLLRSATGEKEIWGGEAKTTNNRMELTAAIRAFEALSGPSQLVITTDSQYVRKGITEWIHRWKRNGWKTVGSRPVKNRELWRRLDELSAGHEVNWCWVKGHSGHEENERADALANRGIDDMRDNG